MNPALRPRRPVTSNAAADRIPYVLIGWKLPHTVLHYWWRPCQFSSIIRPLEPSTHAYRVAHLPLVSRQSRSTCMLVTNPFVAAETIPGTKQVTVEVTLRSGLLSKRGKAFLRRRKHGLTLHGQVSRAQLHVWARLRSSAVSCMSCVVEAGREGRKRLMANSTGTTSLLGKQKDAAARRLSCLDIRSAG